MHVGFKIGLGVAGIALAVGIGVGVKRSMDRADEKKKLAEQARQVADNHPSPSAPPDPQKLFEQLLTTGLGLGTQIASNPVVQGALTKGATAGATALAAKFD